MLANYNGGTFHQWIERTLKISIRGAYTLLNIYKNVSEDVMKSFHNSNMPKTIIGIFGENSNV